MPATPTIDRDPFDQADDAVRHVRARVVVLTHLFELSAINASNRESGRGMSTDMASAVERDLWDGVRLLMSEIDDYAVSLTSALESGRRGAR